MHQGLSLNQAIGMQPLGIQIWVYLLVLVHLAAVFFIIKRVDNKIRIQWNALYIIISFLAAGIFMSWLYEQVGFVRLLGLPHLLFWTPVYVWTLVQYRREKMVGWFRRYVLVYFVIAGISLVIDVSDVVRYLLGEQQVLL